MNMLTSALRRPLALAATTPTAPTCGLSSTSTIVAPQAAAMAMTTTSKGSTVRRALSYSARRSEADHEGHSHKPPSQGGKGQQPAKRDTPEVEKVTKGSGGAVSMRRAQLRARLAAEASSASTAQGPTAASPPSSTPSSAPSRPPPLTLEHFVLRTRQLALFRAAVRATRSIPNPDARRETVAFLRGDFERFKGVTDTDRIRAQLTQTSATLKRMQGGMDLVADAAPKFGSFTPFRGARITKDESGA